MSDTLRKMAKAYYVTYNQGHCEGCEYRVLSCTDSHCPVAMKAALDVLIEDVRSGVVDGITVDYGVLLYSIEQYLTSVKGD